MSDSEKEPYSIIFASLKHPVRRKILRMLSEKPKSFSEILESLEVSSSYLTYHIENLGQLVSKMDDGKYKLSAFGEAAVGTMSKVEDMPRATALQPKEYSEAGSNKLSQLMQILANIYTLILVGAVILASVYFVNFVTSPLEGPYTTIWGEEPVLLQPNGTFTYKIGIVFKTGGNITWRVGVLENDTHYYDFDPPYVTPTSWNTLTLWAMLTTNESFYTWTTTYYPDGHNETYEQEGIGAQLIPTQNAQAGTYKIEIKNISSQGMHAMIELHLEREFFEKPYFYIGIVGLCIALFYPLLLLLKGVHRIVKPTDRLRQN